jgi:GR25 family glycosyltransferase involved in LPS biosynthesis
MKAFIICLEKYKTSYESAIKTQQRINKIGINSELFFSIDPLNINNLFEKENIKLHYKRYNSVGLTRLYTYEDFKYSMINSEGTKSCFYSHYLLWNKCYKLNENILILEDDAVINVNIIKNLNIDNEIDIVLVCADLNLKGHSFLNNNQAMFESLTAAVNSVNKNLDIKLIKYDYINASIPGAVGYVITPKGAEKLLKEYHLSYLPADRAINTDLLNIWFTSNLGVSDINSISLTRELKKIKQLNAQV